MEELQLRGSEISKDTCVVLGTALCWVQIGPFVSPDGIHQDCGWFDSWLLFFKGKQNKKKI